MSVELNQTRTVQIMITRLGRHCGFVVGVEGGDEC